MERDLVCGQMVEAASALTTRYREVRYFFCSIKCKLQFEGEPEAYIDAAERKGEKPLPTQSMVDGPVLTTQAGSSTP